MLPQFGSQSIADLIPALIARPPVRPSWLPLSVWDARNVVVLVLDGLGRLQLDERRAVAPVMASMGDGWLTSVAPSTTAAGLTSITTGVAPGEHGVVGYRVRTRGDVLNTLRWQLDGGGDARRRLPAAEFQPISPFMAASPTVITKYEFATTGFTDAHLRGSRWRPWSVPSGIVANAVEAVAGGSSLVYAYYDGVDKVSHLSGLGAAFDRELAFADFMVSELLAQLPAGTALVVTADHGQVHVGDAMVDLDPAVADLTSSMSGEGRFRWLHARQGSAAELLARADALYRDRAWVLGVDEIMAQGWFGAHVTDAARSRLGDVALVPFAPISFEDPADTGSFALVGRHGSLTPEEMYVPLLAGVATG